MWNFTLILPKCTVLDVICSFIVLLHWHVISCRLALIRYYCVQVYIIGGDGTQKGAAVIYEVFLLMK